MFAGMDNRLLPLRIEERQPEGSAAKLFFPYGSRTFRTFRAAVSLSAARAARPARLGLANFATSRQPLASRAAPC